MLPIIASLRLKERIGVVENDNGESELINPIYVSQTSNDSIYIVDKVNSWSEIINVNYMGKVNWRLFQYSDGRRFNLSMLKILKDGTMLAVDKHLRKVVEIDKQGNILWEFQGDEETLPVAVDRLNNGDTVILDLNKRSIYAINKQLQTLWELSLGDKVCEPTSIQVLSNGNVLLVDEELHIVTEISPKSEVVWQFGIRENSGNSTYQLASPLYACRLLNGNTLIADSNNNRVIEINRGGEIVWCYKNLRCGNYEMNLVFNPSWVERKTNGNTLIADTRNQRVIEVNKDNEIVWSYGSTNVSKRLFYCLRSIQILKDEKVLVSDTCNNRILILDNNGEIEWSYGQDEQFSNSTLFWPRSAQMNFDGNILVTDGRHNRILILDKNKRIMNNIDGYWWRKKYCKFSDPHCALQLNNGNLLVTDTINNTVVEIEPETSMAIWVYGENNESKLNDPHRAVRNKNGDTLIADSANGRLLIVNLEYKILSEIKSVFMGGTSINLYWPRFCDFIGEKFIFFVDGGTGNIFITDYDGKVFFCIKAEDKYLIDALKGSRGLASTDGLVFYIAATKNSILYKTEVCFHTNKEDIEFLLEAFSK